MNNCVDVRQLATVVVVGEPVATDDAVNFLLCGALDMRVKGKDQMEHIDD